MFVEQNREMREPSPCDEDIVNIGKAAFARQFLTLLSPCEALEYLFLKSDLVAIHEEYFIFKQGR